MNRTKINQVIRPGFFMPMPHKLQYFCTIFIFICCFAMPIKAQTIPDGTYSGQLEVQGTSVELFLSFAQQRESDEIICRLSVPKQNVSDFQADACIVTDTSILVDFKSFSARFAGRIGEQGEITGTWSQGGLEVSLLLKPEPGGLKANRPQEPRPPFPYEIQDLEILNPEAENVTLSGTLTMPPGEGTFPLVILISGSGPQNRDSEIFGHKPFWVIADYLTRHGIGVFRFDDRGIGSSRGNFQTATSQDFASDVVAIVSWLARHEKRAGKIGLIGHSEGGLIAPLAANAAREVDFIVLLAGPGMSGRDILLAQTRIMLEKSGTNPGEIERQTDYARSMYDLIGSVPLDQELDYTRMKALTRDFYDASDEAFKAQFGTYEKFHISQAAALGSPWMRYFISYHPGSALGKLDIPVFAINGSLDTQVPARENLERIQHALSHLPGEKLKTWEVPGLNHLFQEADSGLPGEYGEIRETFSEQVLQSMTSWILHIGR